MCLGLTSCLLIMQPPVVRANGAEESGSTITINRDYFEQLLLNEFTRRVDDMSEEQLNFILSEVLKDQRSMKTPMNDSKYQPVQQQQQSSKQQQKSIPNQALESQQQQDTLIPKKENKNPEQIMFPTLDNQPSDDSGPRPNINSKISETETRNSLFLGADQLERKFQQNKSNQKDFVVKSDLTEKLLEKRGVEILSSEQIPVQQKQKESNLFIDGTISIIVFAFDKMLQGFQGLGTLFRQTASMVKLDGVLLRNIAILSTLAFAIFLATRIRLYLASLQIMLAGNLNEIIQQFNKAKQQIFGTNSQPEQDKQNQTKDSPTDQIQPQNSIPPPLNQVPSINQHSRGIQWKRSQNEPKQSNLAIINNKSSQANIEENSLGSSSATKKVLWTRQSDKIKNKNMLPQQNNLQTSSISANSQDKSKVIQDNNKVINKNVSTSNSYKDSNGVNLGNGSSYGGQSQNSGFQHDKNSIKGNKDQMFEIDSKNDEFERQTQDPWRVPRTKVLQTDNGIK